MADWVVAIRVLITRFVSDELQPAVIEYQFTDAHGGLWAFTEKTVMVSTEYLND